jgi:hypothetical protein
MQSAKEIIKSIMNKMPADATYEDILYEIYVQQNIEIGLDQLKKGNLVSEELALKRLKKWLD